MNSTLSYYKQDSSERLSFRRLTLNDVQLWSRFFENNDRENFLGPVNSELTNFQKANNWITRQIERYESNYFFFYVPISAKFPFCLITNIFFKFFLLPETLIFIEL